MQEKIIEIIVLILNELRNSKHINEIDIKKLNRDGYTEAEINAAFAWVFSKLDSGEKLFNERQAETKSHRFFHPSELSVLDTSATGYLIQMKELGILSDPDLELVIDKVLMAGYQKAGIEEIKLIISSLLFDFDEKTNLINRMVLQNNDTVH
ncbi:MAG: Protein Smg [Ignavibacteria bacterium]|nr:Protein Smg [Ignavibacteria bacterium]